MKPTLPAGVKIGKPCIQKEVNPVAFTKGEWSYHTEHREVTVLAVVGAWAMVRRKGAMPFVCSVKDLLPLGAEVTG